MTQETNTEIPFVKEHIDGTIWLVKRWSSWYPMRETPQGTLAFLHTIGDLHDGSEESARRIAKRHIGGGR